MGNVDPEAPQLDRMRLHIAPFTADLYDRIVPPSLQPLASGTSFHTIQTFPEKGYGFVELPAAEAQKLRKKLNGMTLKGSKMSVEEARPVRKRKGGVDDEEGDSERKKAKREKKERWKKGDGVLAGHELEEGRRVKRGWTGDDGEGTEKKRSKKEGKEGDDGERKLRFKTLVPPNKATLEGEREKKKKKEKKEKKEKKSKKDKDEGKTVVEEFKRSKKSRQDVPANQKHAPGSLAYKEGKGWVDEEGHVVEPERKSKRSKKKRAVSPVRQPSADASDAVAGAEPESPDEDTSADAKESTPPQAVDSARPDPDSSSSDSGSEDEQPQQQPPKKPKEVHPLEALFKRPAAPAPTSNDHEATQATSDTTPNKPRPARIDTSFSFFGSGGDNAEGDENDEDTKMEDVRGGMPPATPHTRRDLEWRSLRSAAPTPDTAAIGRKLSFPFANGVDDDEEDGDEDEDDEDGAGEDAVGQRSGESRAVDGDGRAEESSFRKWFFEHRGDLNRGWKKRRREERKAVRQRENRRVGRKVA